MTYEYQTARDAINRLKWPLPLPPFLVCWDVFKQQYTSCMKVGSDGNLGLIGEYSKNIFGPIFHLWWNFPLRYCSFNKVHYSSCTQ